MRYHSRLIALLSATILVSCNQSGKQPSATLEADIEAINALNDEYIAAENTGNVDGIMMLYTDDAVMMMPNQPALIGKESIRSYLQALLDKFAVKETLSSEEVVVSGEWAYVRATYTVTISPRSGGEPVQDKGKGIAIYKKQPDGSWKYARLILNSDQPLPSQL